MQQHRVLLAEDNKINQVVAVGTPEEIASNPASHTGHWLAPVLKPSVPTPQAEPVTA